MKHTMLKCLSLVLALATLVSVCALPAIAASVTPCNHYAYEEEWTYIGEKDPTCTEYGGKVYLCPNCDQQFVDSRDWANNEYKPLGHDWEEVDRQDATLTEDGWVDYECTRCDAEKREPLSATKCEDGCDFDIVDTATCTEAGTKTMTCTVCGNVETVASPAKGHTWDEGEIVKAPICGFQEDEDGDLILDENDNPIPNYGIIKFTCTVCEDGERIDDKVLPHATSHKWEWIDALPTACGVAGCKAGYKCHYCDADYPVAAEDYEYLPAPEHQLVPKTDDEHQNTPLGCVDEVIWAECSVCFVWVDISDRTATGTGVDSLGTPWYGNHYIEMNEDGYTLKDKATTMILVTRATCDSAAIYKCSVAGCTHVTAVGTKKPHNFDTDGDGLPNVTEATCTSYGFMTCKDCGATAGYKDMDGNILYPEFNKKPHEAINENAYTITEAGCVTPSYKIYTCKWCQLPQQDEVAPANGHTKVETLAQLPNCTEGGWTYGWVCELDDECDGKSEWFGVTESTPVGPLGHEWEYKTGLPANCKYGVHDGQICKRCGIENLAFTPTQDNLQKDPNAHVWDAERKLYTAPTCTKPGLSRDYCALCNAENENEISPLHHSFEVVNAEGEVIAFQNPVGQVPALCNANGYNVYFCTNENCDIADDTTYGNKYTYTDADGVEYISIGAGSISLSLNLKDRYNTHYDSVSYTYNPVDDVFEVVYSTDHDADGKPGVLVGPEVVAGTKNPVHCGTYSYFEYVCDHCAYTYNKNLSDDYGLTGNHVASDPFNVGATCTVPGWIGRVQCTRCDIIMNQGTQTTAAHTFDTTITTGPNAYRENVAPTCLDYGFEKAGYCTVCQGYAMENPVNPTGHAVGNQTPAQSANCYQAGWDAHFNCANDDCDYVLNNAALVDATTGAALTGDALAAAIANVDNWVHSIGVNIGTTADPEYINGYVPMREHDMVYAGTDLYACMDDGYVWFECSYAGCDHVAVEANFYFGFYNHRHTGDADYSEYECESSYLTCENKVQAWERDTIVLVLCGNVLTVREVDETKSHLNAATEIILGLDECKNWVETQDHVCTTCETDFTFEVIHERIGNYDEFHQDANCKNYKHDVNTCYDCGYIWITGVVEGYGNHVERVVDSAAATHIAGGYTKYECTVCGATRQTTTNALPGVLVDLSYANKHAGYAIFDGSIVAIKVSTSAFNVGASSIKIVLNYNANVFEYVGFSANNDFGTASYDVLAAESAYNPNATNVAYGANGVVTMVSVAENTVNGVLQNEILNGKEDYMTLYFRVANDATASNEDMAFEVASVEILAVKEVTVQGVTTKVTAPVDDVTVGDEVDLTGEILKIADINGDGFIALEDVEAMRKLVLMDAAYEAPVAGAADINKDGVVNGLDYALLQKKILGILDYEALANELVGSALA